MFTLNEILKPWSKESVEKVRMLKKRKQAEVSRLCRLDYGCEQRSKRSGACSFKTRFFSRAKALCKRSGSRSTTQTREIREQESCAKTDSSKIQIVAKRNICGFNRSKKSLFRFVASKTEFRKLSINRSKDLKASATVRRLLAYKNIQ